jgi:hypothetical protein
LYQNSRVGAYRLCVSYHQVHRRRQLSVRYFFIAGCGVLILLIVMGTLGFSLYTYFHPQQNPSDHHGILYCYSCDLVKGKDIVTYEEKRKLCCVGKNAELKIAKDKVKCLIRSCGMFSS